MKFQERLMFYPFNREETAISKTLRLWLAFAGEMFTFVRGNNLLLALAFTTAKSPPYSL